jgi:cytoskeletal protein RodZ
VLYQGLGVQVQQAGNPTNNQNASADVSQQTPKTGELFIFAMVFYLFVGLCVRFIVTCCSNLIAVCYIQGLGVQVQQAGNPTNSQNASADVSQQTPKTGELLVFLRWCYIC